MAASVTNMVGPPRQEWIIITLWIPVEKFHLMLWLREGFINIQTVLWFAPHWHVHIAAYPAAEMEYTVCALLKGTAEVGVEGSAQRYSTSHTDLAVGGGGREREGRGGNYRREMATERAVDCEVIHETRTLIPLDLSDPPTCSLRNQKVYSTYGLEGVVGATSAADISVKTCKQTCCLITRTLSRHRRRTYADVVITQLPIY